MSPHSPNSHKRRRIYLTAFLALGIGIIVSILLRPLILRELAFHRLFSEDSISRNQAATYLLQRITINNNTSSANTTIPRLANDKHLADRIINRLGVLTKSDTNYTGDIFDNVVVILIESAWWKPEYIPPNIWKYRVNRLLDAPSIDSARLALNQLIIWESHQPGSSRQSDFNQIWLRLITRKDDPDLRLDTFISSLIYLTPFELQSIGLLDNALADSDPRLRRNAWITIGLINPDTGYSANWLSEPDSAVVEAILWAALQTNPDQSRTLIRAVSATPWKTTILPWLLAKSPTEESLRILLGLNTDGNPAAAIPLLMRLRENAPLTPAPSVAAFLGLPYTDIYGDNPVLMRWYQWRTATPHTWTIKQFTDMVRTPEAEDGSVWAAILLANRLLPQETANQLSTLWLSSLDEIYQRAGLLLAGLLNTHHDEINTILQSPDSQPTLRRYAALAQMILQYRNTKPRYPDDPIPTDILFARRLISPALADKDLDIMTALLAIHDDWVVRQILNNPEITASDRLLRFQWLIETFLPDQYEIVAPLDPWNESVAHLQCDIMNIGYDLHHDKP